MLKRWVFLVFIAIVLSGCGYLGGNRGGVSEFTTGDKNPLLVNQQVYAVCTPLCRTQGQCGLAPGAATVVFANGTGPATQRHNLLVSHNASLRILEVNDQQTYLERDTSRLERVNFYRVSFNDYVTNTPSEAWIAGWCVANQTGDTVQR